MNAPLKLSLTQTTPEELTIFVPNGDKLMALSRDRLQTAEAMVIDSPEMADIAAGELRSIKKFADELDGERKSLVAPLNTIVKTINDAYREPLALCTQGEGVIKQALLRWTQEAERRAEQEAARLRDLAAREAARLEARAEKLEAKGNTESAMALAERAQATVAAAANLPVTAAKPAGVSKRDNWKSRCTDKLALIRYIAEHPEFAELLEFSPKAGDKLAKALKSNLRIPGIQAYNDTVIAARA